MGRTLTSSAAATSLGVYRHAIGRVIPLGLEILVAADIIRSVGVTPTSSP
jgi:uncharacterized membrane protein